MWCSSGPLSAADNLPVATPPSPREMTTDRPDTTESPFTLEPGQLQLEMDVATFTRNRLDGVRTTEWQFAPFNLRYGLTRDVEAGIFFTPRVRVTEEPRGGSKTTHQGTGDTTLRTKLNLWGNDGGANAGGVIAEIKLPTAAAGLGNDKVEGAVMFPVAFELGAGWELGAMTVAEFAYTDMGRRRTIWVNTMSFGHDVAKDTGMYFELTSAAGDGPHVATFNCGVTRKLNPNLQLDCGAVFGISRTAPDLGLFTGLARRF
jgi:hypothetical protein